MKLNKNKLSLSAIFISLSLVACSGGSDDSPQVEPEQPTNPPTTPAPGPSPAPINAKPGDVVTLTSIETGVCADVMQQDNGIAFVKVIDCNNAHEFQIAGRYEVQSNTGEFPGTIAIDREAHKQCRPVFEAFTGQPYTGRGLGIEVITPSAASWDSGDTEVLCLVVNADRSMLTASTRS